MERSSSIRVVKLIELVSVFNRVGLLNMDVGDATSTTSMDVVKVGLEKQVGLELEEIQG